MNLPQQKDSIHKSWLLKIIQAIADDRYLASVLFFTGGTCAAMLGWLDRFSVDLDFDYVGTKGDIQKTRTALEALFATLGLTIKDQSKRGIQYFLKYEDGGSDRKIVKIDSAFPVALANTYATIRLLEIDRMLTCQTKETMFANKLIAVMGRYKRTGHIAGRDIYDVDYFFKHGASYNEGVIRERSGKEPLAYFAELLGFIEKHVTDKVIADDLNMLLTPKLLVMSRRFLKQSVLVLLRDEIKRLENK